MEFKCFSSPCVGVEVAKWKRICVLEYEEINWCHTHLRNVLNSCLPVSHKIKGRAASCMFYACCLFVCLSTKFKYSSRAGWRTRLWRLWPARSAGKYAKDKNGRELCNMFTVKTWFSGQKLWLGPGHELTKCGQGRTLHQTANKLT